MPVGDAEVGVVSGESQFNGRSCNSIPGTVDSIEFRKAKSPRPGPSRFERICRGSAGHPARCGLHRQPPWPDLHGPQVPSRNLEDAAERRPGKARVALPLESVPVDRNRTPTSIPRRIRLTRRFFSIETVPSNLILVPPTSAQKLGDRPGEDSGSRLGCTASHLRLRSQWPAPRPARHAIDPLRRQRTSDRWPRSRAGFARSASFSQVEPAGTGGSIGHLLVLVIDDLPPSLGIPGGKRASAPRDRRPGLPGHRRVGFVLPEDDGQVGIPIRVNPGNPEYWTFASPADPEDHARGAVFR